MQNETQVSPVPHYRGLRIETGPQMVGGQFAQYIYNETNDLVATVWGDKVRAIRFVDAFGLPKSVHRRGLQVNQHTGLVRVLNNEDMWIASFKELADAEKWAVENDELTPRVKVVLIDEPTLEDKLQMSILANTLRALLDTQGIEQVRLLLQEAKRTPRMYFPVISLVSVPEPR